MRTRFAVLAVLTGAGALTLGACGGDDDDAGGGDVSAEEQPYVDALVVSFTSGSDEDLQLTDEQAECVAPRWIDTIGMERIDENEVAPEDIGGDGDSELSDLGLSEAEGNELYDAFGACDVDIEQAFVEGIASSGELSDEAVTCLAEQFDGDTIRQLLVTTITEGEAALQEDDELTSLLLDAFAGCPDALPD